MEFCKDMECSGVRSLFNVGPVNDRHQPETNVREGTENTVWTIGIFVQSHLHRRRIMWA
jgi:hypothetical protein